MNESEKRKSMISVRDGYSDRNGLNPVCNVMQVDDLDDHTRKMLENRILQKIDEVFSLWRLNFPDESVNGWRYFVHELLVEVFGESIYPNNNLAKSDIFNKIKDVILQAPIEEVWDIIEFICKKLAAIIYDIEVTDAQIKGYYFYEEKLDGYGEQAVKKFFSDINAIFESKYIAYRFVNGIIIQNTNNIEIAAIEEASTTKFDGCNKHIEKATAYLYDRENPDYKNSIKESISAVEAICCIITNTKNATLGQTLRILEEKQQLNGQLKAAFEKLYAYTNNAGGIRHANPIVPSEVSFAEAKFILISCCAFVNYLIEKYSNL